MTDAKNTCEESKTTRETPEASPTQAQAGKQEAANPSPSAQDPFESEHCSYLDCLFGRAKAPGPGPGKGMFQLLMVGGMVTFMVSYNGTRHAGWDPVAFLSTCLWMYPLVFCIALLVRIYVGDKLVGWLVPRIVTPYFQGLGKSVVMTILNCNIMGCIMTCIVTLLLSGTENYAWEAFSALLSSIPVSMTINFFIVGPAVKILYNDVIMPSVGVRIFEYSRRVLLPLLAFFGQ